jgi:hypothetical protein
VSPRLLRFGFLALLAGGLLLIARARTPRDMLVEVDLTGALPGDVIETDVVVSREEHSLARVDEQYGASGAPGLLRVRVRARPGPASVEVTLVASGGAARRTMASVELSPERPARVEAR